MPRYVERDPGTSIPTDEAKRLADLLSSGVKATASARESGSPAAAQAANFLTSQFYEQQATAQTAAEKSANDPFASETGWVNESFGWTADGRLIQRIVGNSGKILGYVYADNGSKADPNAVVPGKVVTQAAGTANQAKKTSAADLAAEKEKRQASAYLKSWLSTFFDPTNDADTISALMSFVDQQITEDVPTEAIMLNMRGQKFYQQRFSANAELAKKGLAELTPAEYLQAERSYSQILTNAGLGQLSNRTNFNKLIGGEVSTVELQDRVTNVYDRINNADTALQDELGKFFNMGLGKSDLAAALLTGTEGATSLKRKISMAEIGAEFTPRGLQSTLGISELANLGVTREQARQGAEYIRQGAPRLAQLAGIYSPEAASPEFATQIMGELEAEAFKGLESQRRKMLTGREKAAFSGQTGTGTPSLTRSSAGAI